MLERMFNRFGYGRRRRRRTYYNYGRGALLPLAALFGWRNRERIRQFFRDRFHLGSQDPMMRRGT